MIGKENPQFSTLLNNRNQRYTLQDNYPSSLVKPPFVGRSDQGANGITCTPLIVQKPLSGTTSEVFRRSLDTLKVSVWLDWFTADFYSALERAKDNAQGTDIPFSIVDFHNENWNVARNAPGYFRYKLSSGDVTILLSRHDGFGNVPNCQIEVGSLSCWATGGTSLVLNLINKLNGMGSSTQRNLLSRVDLAADQVGEHISSLDVDNEDLWICKARNFSLFRHNRKLTGITYGKGNLMLRIFDKVAELKTKQATNKQEAFAQIWGMKNYDDKPVTRTEFQLRRPALKEFKTEDGSGIDTIEDLEKNMSSLWEYATNQWARHNESAVDRDHNNQKRAKKSAFWTAICNLSWIGSGNCKRVVEPSRKNIAALRAQATGILTTIVACCGLDKSDYFNIISTAQRLISEDLHTIMTDRKSFFERKYDMRQAEGLTAVCFQAI